MSFRPQGGHRCWSCLAPRDAFARSDASTTTGNESSPAIELHSSSRSMSHPGLSTSAPRSRARWHNARSADTSVTGASASAITANRVSSPLPAAWSTETPLASPTPTPPRAAASRTTTTGPVSRPASAAARTRVTNECAAPGRSRHQPFGREPTTFAASMRSTTSVSPAGRPVAHCVLSSGDLS
jgi:hypothetical protein